jgi:hypothetical protein
VQALQHSALDVAQAVLARHRAAHFEIELRAVGLTRGSVWTTAFRISFPFFDPELISGPGNVLPLYKRMFKPGIDDLAFIGLGQTAA